MTLYRKYRSQKLSELVGQSQVSAMLSQAITSRKFAHAYLFAGPRGTGKTSVARIVAKAANCLSQDDKTELPCNQCANCLEINKGTFLDVVEIDAASHTGVDNVRELIEQAQSVPSIGEFKVYILDEVHMLSTAAFNALLKTLEEPPSHVVFILCTTESHKVPVTIASRCQRFVFSRANNTQLQQLLTSIAKKEDIKIEDSAIALLSQLADGGYRDGLMLLEQITGSFTQSESSDDQITRGYIEQQLGLASREVTHQVIEAIVQKESTQAIEMIEKFSASGGEIRYLLSDLIQQLRLLLFFSLKTQTAKTQIDLEQSAWYEAISNKTTSHQVVAILKELIACQSQKSSSTHSALNLELAILSFSNSSGARNSDHPNLMNDKPKVVTPNSSAAVQSKAPVSPAPATPEELKPAKSIEIIEEEEVSQQSQPEPIQPPADLLEGWQRVLSGVVEQNRSVGALLRHHCTPISHDGTIILLQFWNAFHKKQVELDKNRRLVESIAESVFGQPIKIRGQLADKSLRPRKRPMSEEDLHNVAPVEEENLVDTAAEIFGGEFID